MNEEKILVTGGTGMVGVALQRELPHAQFLSSKSCDLTNQEATESLFEQREIERIIHLAAKVGGIKANSDNLATFCYENSMMNNNLLHTAQKHGVTKILSLLSTCVYPDLASYPLTEEQIHDGRPHSSNYAYAYAKRMLDVQSRAYRDQYGCNFITAVPNNLFGENDNFDLENSHVIPAIIRKVYEAKQNGGNVTLWGDGAPLREFTYTPDLAKILHFVLENYDDPTPLNVGNTVEIEIKRVALLIAEIFDFKGELKWDSTKPKGQFRKPSDNSKLLKLGWSAADYTPFPDALESACHWFAENYPKVRGVA
jgi:GDP-L-fucose synthase